MLLRLLLTLALALAPCGALQLVAPVRPRVAAPHASRARTPIADESTETSEKSVEIINSEISDEQMAAIRKAESEDPLMIAAGGDSDFVRWFRFEQAKEEYLKENPTDVLGNAVERLKGPLSSLAIITAGFYAIPLVRGLAEGIRSGDVVGTLSNSLGNPTDAVNGIF